jgi:uncharacterized protein with HEPN domain
MSVEIKDRVVHMLEAIQKIEEFTINKSFEDFEVNSQIQYACLYSFSIIGEAVNFLPEKIKDKYPYPYYLVRSMRNYANHTYHKIDIKIIWNTINEELPAFKQLLELILKNEFN